MELVPVELGARAYDVRIGSGIRASLGAMMAETGVGRGDGRRAFCVLDGAVATTHAPAVLASLEAAGWTVDAMTFDAVETRKTLDGCATILEGLARARVDRAGIVVAMGGGIVGDVAGFAAATWRRGVPVVQVPTTLLAMVDASVGGKTGVNLAMPDGHLGKNMVGAFWQPSLVVADVDVLATLDARERRCGLAESVKHAVIADAALFARLEDAVEPLLAVEREPTIAMLARSIGVKARIVARDEQEGGERALLNLGHTFAHAIEPIPSLGLRHGEAVAIGLAAATAVAIETGRLSPADAARIIALLERIGLPVRLPAPAAIEPLLERMGHDKKVLGGRLRLVLPTAIGGAAIVDDLDPDLVRVGWAAVGAE